MAGVRGKPAQGLCGLEGRLSRTFEYAKLNATILGAEILRFIAFTARHEVLQSGRGFAAVETLVTFPHAVRCERVALPQAFYIAILLLHGLPVESFESFGVELAALGNGFQDGCEHSHNLAGTGLGLWG